jgi:acetyl-CoA synthetase
VTQETYPVPTDFDARIGPIELDELHDLARSDPDRFWLDQAKRLTWNKFPQKAGNWSFDEADFRIRWYEDGALNLSVNCLDRHVAEHGDRTALIFEADEPGDGREVSYRELFEETCRLANLLKQHGVGRGDRVMIYMPMIPEAAAAMLACARIGAVHSVVFGGFSPDSLAGRIADCGAVAVITADEGVRGGKRIPLKRNVDEALQAHDVPTVIVVTRTGADVPMKDGRDLRYSDVRDALSVECNPEIMNAEDPLFILYTSGSTGKPKGVVHTTGGYAVWAATTFDWIFDCRPDDIFWCTADIGWVTGHTYVVYGPLAMGARSVMFDGVPNYPDFGRFWETVDRLGVTIFYTAPTAIRALEREGDEWVTRHSRQSLRLLGTVGEPINPHAWEWYWRVVGDGRCPVVDTWWQTETGGALISPLPGAIAAKPGSATKPLPGVYLELVDSEGKHLDGAVSGNLCLTASWPGQMRTVWGDDKRFFETYFTTYRDKYFTGDGCRRDEDDYYWITGRVDDVINVSGHRIGSAEVESSIVSHPKVAEAAVVGFPHDIKGSAIYAFVTLNAGEEGDDVLRKKLVQEVRHDIGALAAPEKIHFTPALPKTRSGKIMRRILRKIAEGATDGFGDTSTLADPSVVDALLVGRQ